VSGGFSDFPLSLWGAVHLPTYVLGALIIVLLPGPNSLYVLATAAQRGVRAGYRAAGGVFIGDTVLMVLAAAGIASVLRAYPALFAVFKFSGAAYLAYLGVRMILGALRTPTIEPNAVPAPVASTKRVQSSRPLRRALGVSLMNPKAILFFVAFFVQFVDPSYPHPALSFLVLGVILQILSLSYLSALIFGGVHLAAAFSRRRRLAKSLNTGAGALFLGFSAKLATATVG